MDYQKSGDSPLPNPSSDYWTNWWNWHWQKHGRRDPSRKKNSYSGVFLQHIFCHLAGMRQMLHTIESAIGSQFLHYLLLVYTVYLNETATFVHVPLLL